MIYWISVGEEHIAMIMQRKTVGFSICEILNSADSNTDDSSVSTSNEPSTTHLKSVQKQSPTSANPSLIEERISNIVPDALPFWLTCVPPVPFERNFIVAQQTGTTLSISMISACVSNRNFHRKSNFAKHDICSSQKVFFYFSFLF